MTATPNHRLRALALLVIAGTLRAQDEPTDTDTAIRDAIRALQGVDMANLEGAAQDHANRMLNNAWQVLRADPDRSIPALKAAVNACDEQQKKDDFFRLEAGCLLYAMAEMEEIDAIAHAVRDIDPNVSVRLTSSLAAHCARSQDPRVLPVLGTMLRTNDESPPMYFPMHAFAVPWPVSLDFVWGPYGTAANDYLMKQLLSENVDVRRSALHLLTTYRHMPVLEVCREWAADEDHASRDAALLAIGTFADPQDRELLVAATRDDDAGIRFAAVYALYEYGDPATAPALRALLGDADPRVRGEAVAAVAHVIDPAGGLALAQRLAVSSDDDEKAKIRHMLGSLAADTDVDQDRLEAADEAAWQQAITAYWKMRDTYFDLRDDDRKLSREQFLAAIAAWSEEHSMTANEEFGWIERRHLLSAAAPDDIPRLLDLRSRLLWRQSDEVLYEVGDIDRVIEILHRRRIGAPKPNE